MSRRPTRGDGAIPFVLDHEQLARRYRDLLDRRSDSLIRVLRDVVPAPVPTGVTGLEVGLFVEDGDGRWAPDLWLAWTGPHPRLTAGDDDGVHAGASHLLGFDLAGVAAFDPAYFTAEYAGVAVLTEVLAAWFAECWWKAGGWDAPVAAVLVHRDGPDAGRTVRLSART